MTSEQIAELELLDERATPRPWLPYSQRDDRPAMLRAAGRILFRADMVDMLNDGQNIQIDYDACVAAAVRNALGRLLEERKRLLAVARLVWAFGERELADDPTVEEPRELHDAATAAIAYAEEPAP